MFWSTSMYTSGSIRVLTEQKVGEHLFGAGTDQAKDHNTGRMVKSGNWTSHDQGLTRSFLTSDDLCSDIHWRCNQCQDLLVWEQDNGFFLYGKFCKTKAASSKTKFVNTFVSKRLSFWWKARSISLMMISRFYLHVLICFKCNLLFLFHLLQYSRDNG